MKEENKKILTADVIIDEGSKFVIAYKIEGDTYIFANHKINNFAQTMYDVVALADVKQTIRVIYISNEETKEKSMVGCYVGNTMYVKAEYNPSILDSNQLCKAVGYLIVKEFVSLQPEEVFVSSFSDILKERVSAIQEERSRLQAAGKQERHVKYNKKNTYELKIVRDLFGMGVQSLVLNDEEFFMTRRLTDISKEKALKFNIGSKIKTQVWVCDSNVAGIVFCGIMFVKLSYLSVDKNTKISGQELNRKIKVCITGVKNEDRCPIVVQEVPSTKTATAETIDFAQFSSSNAQSAQVLSAETIELAQILPAETSSTTHDAPHSIHAKIIFSGPKPIEATSLANSSAANLKELNSKHCNIL